MHKSVLEMVGNTPILKLQGFTRENGLHANIYGKVEFFNPTGSIKDRIAKAMILQAIEDKKITSSTTVIEPTSGNTGIGLASMCASLGYKLILTMPETMSVERQKLIRAYGAKIVLTTGKLGMKGAIEKANELANEIEDSFIPSQFENMSNPRSHYLTTGPELYKQLDGNIDIVVAGVGTGGTLSGVGKYLKEKNPDIKLIAVEPNDSPVLSKGTPGPHKIQGIGAGFIPSTLDTAIYDEVIRVDIGDAYRCAREVAIYDGILVGISSGAAMQGVVEVLKNPEYQNKNIVVILPDGGDRYLSTELFE